MWASDKKGVYSMPKPLPRVLMQINIDSKILIIGSGGSGKSTLARKLGEVLALPVIHLDKEYWNEGWNPTEKEIWLKKLGALIAAPEWIMDGNYDSSLWLRLQEADTVIFLDFNRLVCIFSVIKRWLTHLGKTRDDMAEGCPEKMDLSFLKWIWQFPDKSRPGIIDTLAEYEDVTLFTFHSRRELRQFINEIAPQL